MLLKFYDQDLNFDVIVKVPKGWMQKLYYMVPSQRSTFAELNLAHNQWKTYWKMK